MHRFFTQEHTYRLNFQTFWYPFEERLCPKKVYWSIFTRTVRALDNFFQKIKLSVPLLWTASPNQCFHSLEMEQKEYNYPSGSCSYLQQWRAISGTAWFRFRFQHLSISDSDSEITTDIIYTSMPNFEFLNIGYCTSAGLMQEYIGYRLKLIDMPSLNTIKGARIGTKTTKNIPILPIGILTFASKSGRPLP